MKYLSCCMHLKGIIVSANGKKENCLEILYSETGKFFFSIFNSMLTCCLF